MHTHPRTAPRTIVNYRMPNSYSTLRVFREAAHETFVKGTTEAERGALAYRPTDWNSLFLAEMADSPEKARKAGIAAAKEILG